MRKFRRAGGGFLRSAQPVKGLSRKGKTSPNKPQRESATRQIGPTAFETGRIHEVSVCCILSAIRTRRVFLPRGGVSPSSPFSKYPDSDPTARGCQGRPRGTPRQAAEPRVPVFHILECHLLAPRSALSFAGRQHAGSEHRAVQRLALGGHSGVPFTCKLFLH